MEKKPNIVFILNDHQAFYGHGMDGASTKPLRPCFDSFASEGAEFTNAYCVTPMCGPARRSLLTGLYPHNHGQIHNETNPDYDDEVYLDTLAENGYRNYYYGKWHAGPGTAQDHHAEGFSLEGYGNPYQSKEYKDYLERYQLPQARHQIEWVFHTLDFDELNYFPKLKEGELYSCEAKWCGEHAIGVTTTPKETHEAFFLANLACEKLEELAGKDREEPFHLRVDFWGPHQPFFPAQEFVDLYDPEDILPYPSFDNTLEDKPLRLKMEASMPLSSDGMTISVPNPLPWEEWQKIMTRCYAHTTMLDEAGGMIVQKLKELGLDENTIVIWSTDHGDAISCQGGHFDKDSHMSQEVMRIPLAMSWKNHIKPHQKCTKPVFTCDIPVTMLDAAGLSYQKAVDGDSLLKLTTGERHPWRKELFCETYGIGYGWTFIGRMVIKGRFKYIYFEDDLDELYDLGKDPYELHNLAVIPEYEELLDEMRELLLRKQKETGDPIEVRFGDNEPKLDIL